MAASNLKYLCGTCLRLHENLVSALQCCAPAPASHPAQDIPAVSKSCRAVEVFECSMCHTTFKDQNSASLCYTRHLAAGECKKSPTAVPEAGQDLPREVMAHIKPGYIWTDVENDALVQAVKDHYHRLTGRGFRRLAVWQDIASVLQPIRPGVTAGQCSTRWRKIKTLFLKYQDIQKKTSTRRKKIPCCYDLLCSFLLEKPGVVPKHLAEAEGLLMQTPSSPETPPTPARLSSPEPPTPDTPPSHTESDGSETQNPPKKCKRIQPQNKAERNEQLILQGLAESKQHHQVIEEQNTVLIQTWKESLNRIEKLEMEKKEEIEKFEREKIDILREKNRLLQERNDLLKLSLALSVYGTL